MPESKTTNQKRSRKSTSSKKHLQPASTQDSTTTVKKKQHMISEAAYFVAEHRGFTPGSELDDWLLAEAQINTEPFQHGG